MKLKPKVTKSSLKCNLLLLTVFSLSVAFVCTRTTCRQKKTVSVRSFASEPSRKVVWTCSHIYLGRWSNKPWKTLLLHYPTGISPVILLKQRDREREWVDEEGEDEEEERERESGVMGREMFIFRGRGAGEHVFNSHNWSSCHFCTYCSHSFHLLNPRIIRSHCVNCYYMLRWKHFCSFVMKCRTLHFFLAVSVYCLQKRWPRTVPDAEDSGQIKLRSRFSKTSKNQRTVHI